MDAKALTEQLRARRAYELTIRADRAGVAVAAPTAARYGAVPFEQPQQDWGQNVVTLSDATTRLDSHQRASVAELENLFRAISMEAAILATPAQLFAVQQSIIDNCALLPEPARYLYSDRPINSGTHCWPLQATEEVTGYLLGYQVRGWHDTARARDYQLVENAAWWRRMRSGLEQVTALDTARQFVSAAFLGQWDANRNQIERIRLERFDGPTRTRAGKDAQLVASLLPGLYLPGISCPQHYHNWAAWDTDNFKVTALPVFQAAEVAPVFGVGQDTSAYLDVFLVPRRHRYTVQWVAVFYFVTWFTLLQVIYANTFAFEDRLPWYPDAFAFTSIYDTAINDTAISHHVAVTNAYAAALNADTHLQFFTPYAALILTDRIHGQWTVRDGSRRAGDLCAIIDRRAKRGDTPERFYVWRKTPEASTGTILDWGSLYTSEVSPYIEGAGISYPTAPPRGPLG